MKSAIERIIPLRTKVEAENVRHLKKKMGLSIKSCEGKSSTHCENS